VSSGEELIELLESKSGQNRHDIRIMTEIEIKALIKRECIGVVIKRYVDL
jgi:hypothetical protein